MKLPEPFTTSKQETVTSYMNLVGAMDIGWKW